MESVGADPAFVRLCRLQESFRARLTPKPWRCGHHPPFDRHPREGKAQERFAKWLGRYETACHSVATCRFVEAIGPGRIEAEVEAVLRVHDETTKAASGLPLA